MNKSSTVLNVNAHVEVNVSEVKKEKCFSLGGKGPAGGKVFHLSGDGLHGLEVAPVDQGVAVWGDLETLITVGRLDEDTKYGYLDTQDIVLNSNAINTAAEVANRYRLNEYADWFLPSKQALYLLFIHKNMVGSFENTAYWSSSELSGNYAFSQCFENGFQDYESKDKVLFVRAIRSF